MSNGIEIIYGNEFECRFKHPDGGVFVGRLGGCGRAIHLMDANGKEKTVIPTNNSRRITKPDLKLACQVLGSIILSEAITRYRLKLEAKKKSGNADKEKVEAKNRVKVLAGD
jgi:hypothetical protein